MDSSSPRRELQGPRPTPLKIRKDSYKIKKPPLAPPPAAAMQPPAPPQQQPRAPVIIYTVSPKVIHANPGEFMTIVQRLTGASSSATAPSAAGGALSPAARMATFEKAASAAQSADRRQWDTGGLEVANSGGGGAAVVVQYNFPGILSPVPSSLPPISPNFFSPSFDLSNLSFMMGLSPAAPPPPFAGGSFLTSPSNFLHTPILPSPGALWDLLNQLEDP